MADTRQKDKMRGNEEVNEGRAREGGRDERSQNETQGEESRIGNV